MEQRYFNNPYEDYKGQQVEVDENYVRNLIKTYVQQIVENTQRGDSRGDLYVCDAGIAFMFLRLCQTNELVQETSARENAQLYISRAKRNAKQYSRSRDERCAFLCGNAGIYAVSAAISDLTQKADALKQDLKDFEQGFEACKPVNFSKYGSDELLVGRAGFLSGVYWLNETLRSKPFSGEAIIELCESIVQSGRQYSKAKRCSFPLMYQYHSTEYLGAAHGLSGIMHMLLESPWFSTDPTHAIPIPKDYEADIKNTIDAFLALQDNEGNFPCDMEDAEYGNGINKLVHWCHGAPGAIYLLIKACLVFKHQKYMAACQRAADLVWNKGLLLKGPGICHGVAGNGYVSLVMYRLTKNPKYFYRAVQFANFLTRPEFLRNARRPDCPWSLYEALQERDGNFPIALDSEKKRNTEKRLIHWCHGASGAIYFFLRAYQIFNDQKYLNACKKAADLIWEKGLLRKGPGICHGITGNGYAFLMLFKITQDQRYLYRAIKFAKFLTKSRFIREANIPDRPYSLYEGTAGAVCFLIDLIHIDEASFPFMKI